MYLKRKYQTSNVNENEELRDIKYRDHELLDTEREEGNSQENVPKQYGGVQLDTSKLSILSKSPNFMILGKIDETEVEVEIEKGIMKARYELMGRGEDRDGKESGASESGEDEQSARAREELDSTLNYAHMRATDIPTVQRLYPPKPATIEKEKVMDCIKEKLMDTVREYKAEHCDSKGNFKQHNLSCQDAKALKELKKEIKDKRVVV